MEKRGQILSLFAACLVIGAVLCVDIQFENSRDGFFLKSPYSKYKAYDPNLEKETFFLTNTDKSQLIKAKYGLFEVYQSVPSIYLSKKEVADNKTRVRHSSVIEGQDVSAHVVTRPIGPDSPNLRVLLHAQENEEAKATEVSFDYALPKDPNQQWCGRVYARYVTREISSACVLSAEKEACVAVVTIPNDWWDGSLTYIDVFYSMSRLDYNQRCTTASNSILPNRMLADFGRAERVYFTRISTLVAVQSYQEKKDQFVLLYVPTKTFHPGSQFEVPVKLEAESSLKRFTIRVKARDGLKILRADISAKSKWTISVDINNEQRSAVVKAYVKDEEVYTKTPWVQDIFRWWFEVDSSLVSPIQDGRLIWNIEYQRNETNGVPMSRIVSSIDLDDEEESLSIIPVLKIDEILNTAVLTGKHQVYPLSIYTVNHGRNVVEITDATMCHSSNEAVIKVSEDCHNIYVDGTETAGAHNVSVIVKYSRETAYAYLRVWVPETRLDIQLSDTKLSQVKGWRSPRNNNRVNKNNHLSLPGLTSDPDPSRCSLRFQQSMLEVYARFHHPLSGQAHGSVFYGNNKAYFRITNLVKGRIRVSDPRIAELKHDMVVNGKQPGRTEIQVLSPSGRVMAAKEIRVSRDKVVLEQALVSMVTGISLEIKASKHIGKAFTSTAHLHHQLQGKYQEGVLDVVLKYSDGTVFPLQFVQPEQYHLDVISLNNHLIEIAPYASPYQPRVKALSQGKGNLLKVLLRLDNSCYKKKTNALATTFVYVDVDITVEKSYSERYQNDGGFLNRASDHRKNGKSHRRDKHPLKVEDANRHAYGQTDTENQATPDDQPKIQVYNINDNVIENELGANSPEHKPQLQYTPVDKGMTPLEIGMYVLLAIFCLAIVVFLVNCIIFVFRYRRKKLPPSKKDLVKNANDWVWIGRATLERNSVTMRSPQALMPASDFNGNHQSSLSHKDSFSEPSSASNSNRNSTISEYKGSECSIRITNNPFEDEIGGAGLGAMAPLSASVRSGLANREPQWDYEAMGMTYDQLLEYFDNLKESTA